MASKKNTHGGKRAGAGRPFKYPSSKRLTAIVPTSLVTALDKKAKREKTSRSDLIVRAIERLVG